MGSVGRIWMCSGLDRSGGVRRDAPSRGGRQGWTKPVLHWGDQRARRKYGEPDHDPHGVLWRGDSRRNRSPDAGSDVGCARALPTHVGGLAGVHRQRQRDRCVLRASPCQRERLYHYHTDFQALRRVQARTNVAQPPLFGNRDGVFHPDTSGPTVADGERAGPIRQSALSRTGHGVIRRPASATRHRGLPPARRR